MASKVIAVMVLGVALSLAGQAPLPAPPVQPSSPPASPEAACWLRVAFSHQAASYEDLLQTRGIGRGIPPPEGEIGTEIGDDFPPNSGVLLYDYIAPWEKSHNYQAHEMVEYRGGLYRNWKEESAVSPAPPSENPDWISVRGCQPASAKPASGPVLRVWLLSKAGMLAYAAIPFSPDELNRALQRCNRSVSVDVAKLADRARGFGIADDPFPAVSFDDALSQLSHLLLPKDFWPSMLQFQDLILVPQLNIAEVPFPLLRGPGGSRLVDSTAFWIARNIRDIEPQDDEQKHGFRVSSWDAKAAFSFDAPLVVGNPAFGSSGNLYLPPLPGAESEARAVASIVHTVPLIGADATKAIVAQRARSADFIYIATHGAALPGDPLSGFLALAGAPDPSGRWTAREIQTMNLRATDLAILSACQTGLGGVHAAGVIGVGRAFTLAGVPWVVMSLWNVDDKATANLIQDFVSEMAACKTLHACLPAEALRRAMTTERLREPDAKKWGAFVVFGVPSGRRL